MLGFVLKNHPILDSCLAKAVAIFLVNIVCTAIDRWSDGTQSYVKVNCGHFM